MEDQVLTPHFSLSEFVKSDTASRLGIDNTPNPQQIENLRALCVNVLEPLRQAMDVPITIGSGYRCPALNAKVGGVSDSKHLYGQAADIHIPDNKTGRQWMHWIIENCQFYKLIWETADRRHFWIHVSYIEGRNLNHVVSYLLKPQSQIR